MGGGGGTQEQEPYLRYGSPYGGAAMNALQPMQIAMDLPRDNRSSEEVSPDEDIEMKFKVRVMNDILRRLLNPEELKKYPEIKPGGSTITSPRWRNFRA